LPLWLDTSQGIELEFKDFASGGRIEVNIVLLPSMLDNNLLALAEAREAVRISCDIPGIVAIFVAGSKRWEMEFVMLVDRKAVDVSKQLRAKILLPLI